MACARKDTEVGGTCHNAHTRVRGRGIEVCIAVHDVRGSSSHPGGQPHDRVALPKREAHLGDVVSALGVELLLAYHAVFEVLFAIDFENEGDRGLTPFANAEIKREGYFIAACVRFPLGVE